MNETFFAQAVRTSEKRHFIKKKKKFEESVIEVENKRRVFTKTPKVNSTSR